MLSKDNGVQLEEVAVVSKLPFVERKIDRTIINPDALIANAGSNALEVLAKSPGVMVTENGTIKLKGKSGVIVLIDDKPTYLSATDLESYLKSLPASQIKQIELMTNPPAQYDAAGNAGVINIKTKRTKLKGINGNVSLNYAQGRYARSNDNFSFKFY
jgi:iron complex outermembrane receptor protein